jgi:hypothetical protein
MNSAQDEFWEKTSCCSVLVPFLWCPSEDFNSTFIHDAQAIRHLRHVQGFKQDFRSDNRILKFGRLVDDAIEHGMRVISLPNTEEFNCKHFST